MRSAHLFNIKLSSLRKLISIVFQDNFLFTGTIKENILISNPNATEAELENVRITALNISFISEVFEENEIEKIYINFCNPWPNDRHNKRRLTHTRFLTEYKKFLKKGSQIWFKTDDTDLFNDSQEYFKECGFSIDFITYDLHNSDFKENLMTEYETKFTGLGMKIMFLIATLK